MKRRSFLLSLGVILPGSLLLKYGLEQVGDENSEVLKGLGSYKNLGPEECLLFLAIAPRVLGTSLDSKQEFLEKLDEIVGELSQSSRSQYNQMIFVLNSRFIRFFIFSLKRPWESLEATEIDLFFQQIKGHSDTKIKQIFLGLVELIGGAYYSQESSWKICGYPGPPEV